MKSYKNHSVKLQNVPENHFSKAFLSLQYQNNPAVAVCSYVGTLQTGTGALNV